MTTPTISSGIAFFCRAALEILHRITRTPCVLHCHDWHASLAPVYLRTYYQDQAFAQNVRTVLTVHNAGFQGHFPPSAMPEIRAALGAVQLQGHGVA